VVFTVITGTLEDAIALADIVRPDSKQAIAALKEMNIRCMMLTGDNNAGPPNADARRLCAVGSAERNSPLVPAALRVSMMCQRRAGQLLKEA